MNNGETLPVASLRLLAPPLRLVSAAVWKVMQQRDVMHYGRLEEFVTSVSETVPGLLSYRHQAKLTVGLQARLILEQLHASQSPDPELILSHLKRLCAPSLPKGKGKDQKVEVAVRNFHSLVHTLINNPVGRQRFFQEEFDSQYGPQYEAALEKLLWEFLTRLDQLLPVPDLTQTVSWLTGAPAVLEECARAASQPQLLRTLLQHERCLGHLDSTASIPSSTGDSILSSLSLPPSGRVKHASNQLRSTTATNMVPSPGPSTQRSNIMQTRQTARQITPVIGSISSKDLPQSTSASDNMVSILGQDSEEELISTEVSSYTRVKSCSGTQNEILDNGPKEEHVGKILFTVISQTSASSEEEDEDEGQMRMVTGGRRRSVASKQKRQKTKKELHGDGKSRGEGPKDNSKTSARATPDSRSQEDSSLPAIIASCMKFQLRVVIPRLDITGATQPVLLKAAVNEEQATKSPRHQAIRSVSKERNGYSINRKRKLSYTSTPEKDLTNVINKQTCAGSPCIPSVMPIRVESSDKDSSPIQSTDDIIIDSEDEAIQNVKGRLFKKRYYKTKDDTYIPTLYEFWHPPFFRRDLMSPGNGSR
ncbi:hypothetical protein P4O66_008617 [Electrophorus voltai]|uniref:TERF1-interacting nuclear factor 2 N-terminal domain-containing protein n=1 Tax=Electrophorus voltai TaxID=2609070 RepID=A0AAD8ZCW3_9TELE|nr:hypothetical protein P4O66_008617 [Electrophorus voltai]